MGGHTGKKLGLSAALIAAAGTLLGVGSFAGWTATTANPNNVVAAGTLTMTNSDGCAAPTTNGTCTAILTAGNTNLKPGGSATGTVTITNTGSLAGVYTLTEGASAPVGGICTTLQLLVKDETNFTDYSGNLNGVPAAGAAVGTLVASTGAHTFTFTVSLPATSTNSDQGATCTTSFTWTAVPA